jgi:hypothetical protein
VSSLIDIDIKNAKPIDIELDQAVSTEIERVAGTTPDIQTWAGILGRPFTYLSGYFYVEDGKLYILTAEEVEEGNNMPPSSNAVYEAIKPLAERVANVKDGKDGLDGKDGRDGYTPIKGIDYFDGKDGENGRDGYTPRKGVDYFDGTNGKDGKTPIKGVDYFDGTNGKDGKDFKYEDFTPEQLASLKGEKGDKGDAGTIDERTQAQIVSEVLDEIPSWARESHKPTYTASEVGALPSTTTIPSALSQLSGDATHRVVTDAEKSAWNNKAETSAIPSDDHINSLIDAKVGVIENGSY